MWCAVSDAPVIEARVRVRTDELYTLVLPRQRLKGLDKEKERADQKSFSACMRNHGEECVDKRLQAVTVIHE